MDKKKLVKLSNLIGVITIILLIYWVFVFISITVFGLKIFRENLTETFYLSIVGILALMFGALIINIMLNLTRIAEKHNQDKALKTASKKMGLVFLLSFPLIFGLLVSGDYLTSKKKEKMLISSAKSIIENSPGKAEKLVNYTFGKEWIFQSREILTLYSKTDTHFPHVSVIVADTLDNLNVFLRFNTNNHPYTTEIAIVEEVVSIDAPAKKDTIIKFQKKDYIRSTTKEEREYLNEVFYNNVDDIRFSAKDGYYELFYPYRKNNKVIVLYFSDYQRYGKFGS
jgi:hypothetical protein